MIEIQKVLITDHVHPVLMEGLERLGYQVQYSPEITLEEVRGIIESFEGIVVNTKTRMDEGMLRRGTRLKFIARLGSGLDIIDLETAAELGIQVLRSPEGNANAVAEHVLGMILALNHKIMQGDRGLRQFIWDREKNRGKELENSTVGIIGFGHTGSKLAEKLKGLNVKIWVYDKYRQQITTQFPFVEEKEFEEILKGADYISFHVPLTLETKYMLRRETLEMCKPGVCIINSSRGKVVHLMDLLEAMDMGKVRGACLDVFENEKPDQMTVAEKKMYRNLYRRENVILTPHIAGWTVESKQKIAEVLLKKIERIKNKDRD